MWLLDTAPDVMKYSLTIRTAETATVMKNPQLIHAEKAGIALGVTRYFMTTKNVEHVTAVRSIQLSAEEVESAPGATQYFMTMKTMRNVTTINLKPPAE